MEPLSLTPLFRRSVGFDRYSDLFNAALGGEETASTYPPYNIEKHENESYRIVMAVAGFSEKELDIMTHGNELTVSGKIEEKEDAEVTYLHRGIATRAFRKSFSLADHVQVQEAELKDGLLVISLKREIPEEAKPRMIEIKK